MYFRNAKTQSATRRLLPGCHIISALGTPAQNHRYCSKTREEDEIPNAVFHSRGDLPGVPADGGPVEANRWEAAWTCAKSGSMEEIPADIRIRCYSTLRRIERDFMPAVVSLEGPCGLWIWGVAGCGKTLSVTRAYPDAYPKPRNVWWDGYQREPIVILDDVDKYDLKLGGYLKHWADAYPFIGEVKGGSMKIRPTKIVVTSQYKIEDIWQDAETQAALLRRFIVVEKIQGQEILLF